jgi:hypothetical protein
VDLANVPGWVVDAGLFVGLVAGVVTAVMRGWLVPGSTVDRLVAAERLRADEHKATADAAEALAAQLAAQNATLIAQGETQTQLLRGIREWAARRRDIGP